MIENEPSCDKLPFINRIILKQYQIEMNVDGYEKISETDAMYNSRLMKAKLAQTRLYCTLEWVEAFMDWC